MNNVGKKFGDEDKFMSLYEIVDVLFLMILKCGKVFFLFEVFYVVYLVVLVDDIVFCVVFLGECYYEGCMFMVNLIDK